MGSVTKLDIHDQAVVVVPGNTRRVRASALSRWRRTRTLDDPGIRIAMDQEIHREMYRSRRYGRSIAVVRVSPPAVHLGDTRGPNLSSFLRLIDRTWTTDGHMWLLLPESDVDDALGLLDRIRANAPLVLTGRSVGLAIFPETALTLEGLLAGAAERSEESFRTEAPRLTVTVAAQHDESVSHPAAM